MTQALYTDGGVIWDKSIGIASRSRIGGTWAWVLVEDDERIISQASGVITPVDMGVDSITNNISELYAALEGLKQVNLREWDGKVCVDSQVTLRRLTTVEIHKIEADATYPFDLRRRLLDFRQARPNRSYYGRFTLLGGHPTEDDLKAGKTKKRGLPCSKWNALCDTMANEAGVAYVKELGL
jgi:ribonuclease HI